VWITSVGWGGWFGLEFGFADMTTWSNRRSQRTSAATVTSGALRTHRTARRAGRRPADTVRELTHELSSRALSRCISAPKTKNSRRFSCVDLSVFPVN
jgi:hypothetical protein